MIRMELIYSYLRHMDPEDRRNSLYQLLSLFTEEELAEVAGILDHVQAMHQARTPPKVSLSR